MKKFFLSIALIFMISTVEAGGDVSKVELDYGASKIYTSAEISAAAQCVLDEFRQWDGCKLHSLRYVGDRCDNPENIHWMNELAAARDLEPDFDQCIEFVSDFRSPVEGGGAWRADAEYVGWQWYLARSSTDDEWHLMTWGY